MHMTWSEILADLKLIYDAISWLGIRAIFLLCVIGLVILVPLFFIAALAMSGKERENESRLNHM